MRCGRRYWARILLVNTVGALAVVAIGTAGAERMTWHSFAAGFGEALIFANCIGATLALGIPLVAERLLPDAAGRWPKLVGAMIVLTAFGTIGANLILLAVGRIPPVLFWRWMLSSFEVSLVISLIIGISITAYETVRGRLAEAGEALRTRERDEAEARRLAAEAQLASLEARVQPHFLFNTLNSIAALVHDDPDGAERMTTQLASLMRSSLEHGSSALVPLEEELRVVRDYFEIERVRFGDRLRYRIDADGVPGDTPLPRLALQTLVENSVKYAVSPRRDGATIRLSARAEGPRLRLTVEDDGPGFDAARANGGHGLVMLRSRLAIAYAGAAALAVDSRPGATRVTLDLPLSAPQPQPRASSPEPPAS